MKNRLSIITINYNNAEGLNKTIESVVNQDFTDFEFIIIDGASTDSSVEVIKQYVDKISYWVSEPDTGIYNAMNKGISKANGIYCLFLNSGDSLVDENVVSDFCKYDFVEDIISGNIYLGDDENAVLYKSTKKDDLSYGLFYEGSIPHPSTFIKHKLFTVYGKYNESFKIVSDWEFFFKVLIVHNCSYIHFDRVISYFDTGGISSRQEWRLIEENERELVLKSNLPLIYKSYKKIYNENIIFDSHEKEYIEYMNLKNGIFSIFIKYLLWLKSKIKLCKFL